MVGVDHLDRLDHLDPLRNSGMLVYSWAVPNFKKRSRVMYVEKIQKVKNAKKKKRYRVMRRERIPRIEEKQKKENSKQLCTILNWNFK